MLNLIDFLSNISNMPKELKKTRGEKNQPKIKQYQEKIQITKRNHVELLELKITITEIKKQANKNTRGF